MCVTAVPQPFYHPTSLVPQLDTHAVVVLKPFRNFTSAICPLKKPPIEKNAEQSLNLVSFRGNVRRTYNVCIVGFRTIRVIVTQVI